MTHGEQIVTTLVIGAAVVATFGQSVVHGIAAERDFFAGLAVAATAILGLLGLLYRAFVGWAKQVQSDVNNFGTRLTAQQDDNVRARGVQDVDATRRHESVLAAIQKHANVTSDTLSEVQLDAAALKARIDVIDNLALIRKAKGGR